jgi:hypothetical protein
MVLAATTGCGQPSACAPPGATSGEIVQVEGSPAYQNQVTLRGGTERPYLACRAQATIPTTITTIDDPTKVDFLRKPIKTKGSEGDPRLLTGSASCATQTCSQYVGTEQGQYRVLGVGRGTDPDDCGKAAIHACDDAVNAYFLRERILRLPSVVCTLAQGEEYCAAK